MQPDDPHFQQKPGPDLAMLQSRSAAGKGRTDRKDEQNGATQ